AALDWILAHPRLGKTRIVVYGQSIGGAVAFYLASRRPDVVRAVVVENSFLSLPRLVPHVLPVVPGVLARLLCHQVWDSAAAVARVPRGIPLLLLSGGRDELVPPAHMMELLRLARSARRGVDLARRDLFVAARDGGDDGGEAAATETKEGDAATSADGSSTSSRATAGAAAAAVVRDADAVRFEAFPHGAHNDTCLQPGYFEAIAAFWSDYAVAGGVPAAAAKM
ncbi:hypothetical protein HK405_002754, partial [Cladochytrium tenue]